MEKSQNSGRISGVIKNEKSTHGSSKGHSKPNTGGKVAGPPPPPQPPKN